MNISTIFALVTPVSLALVAFSGFITGFFVVSMTPTSRQSAFVVAFMLFLLGASFFLPLIIGRAFSGVPNWERTIGTWIEFIIYILWVSAGIRLKNKLRE